MRSKFPVGSRRSAFATTIGEAAIEEFTKLEIVQRTNENALENKREYETFYSSAFAYRICFDSLIAK